MDQNFKCLTPAVTKCVSELERNNARNILSSVPTTDATFMPMYMYMHIFQHIGFK